MVAEEGVQIAPERRVKQDDWYAIGFLCLDQSQYFRQFIQGTKTTWEIDISISVHGHDDFAGSEMLKFKRLSCIFIEILFVGQFDVKGD